MNDDRKREVRTKSMLGTVLLALGIIGTLLFVITGAVWMGAAAVALLVPGIVMLYQVGKTLS
jgi:hypothetical protein